LNCLVHSAFTQHNSHTQFFLHGFGAIRLTSLHAKNYKELLIVLFVGSKKTISCVRSP
jgi:hypothetical protein